jgi:hypothetical protein
MPREFATNADYLRRVKQEYGDGELIDLMESIVPGPGWRDVVWPWQQSRAC